ncbi:hypothetical protein JL721_11710 [Aureococcus anophagefferens]|nr:hypothetical protein JL721_11710 [Aureococcus anophagefferens]
MAGLVAPLLLAAVRDGKLDVVRAEIAAGADLAQEDEDGQSALHYAAQQNAVDAATLLLDAGASVDAVDQDGWTALYAACEQNACDVAKLLIARDRGPRGQRPLDAPVFRLPIGPGRRRRAPARQRRGREALRRGRLDV